MAKLSNLRTVRDRRGWSQQRLADESKVSVDVIRKHEQSVKEDIYLSSARLLAEALEVSIEELYLVPISHETLKETQASA